MTSSDACVVFTTRKNSFFKVHLHASDRDLRVRNCLFRCFHHREKWEHPVMIISKDTQVLTGVSSIKIYAILGA